MCLYLTAKVVVSIVLQQEGDRGEGGVAIDVKGIPAILSYPIMNQFGLKPA